MKQTKQMEDWEREDWDIMNEFAIKHNLKATNDKSIFNFIKDLLLAQREELNQDLKKKIEEWVETNYQLHGESFNQSRCFDYGELKEFLKTL